MASYEKRAAKNPEMEKELVTRDEILSGVKRDLKKAQATVKKYHDKGRRMEELEPGDWVYLKIQPYGQKTLRNKLKGFMGLLKY